MRLASVHHHRRGRVAVLTLLTVFIGALTSATLQPRVTRQPSLASIMQEQGDSIDTVPIFGPFAFHQTGAGAATYVEQFSYSGSSGQFFIVVQNLAPAGHQLIDSASVSINDTVFWGPSAFASRPAILAWEAAIPLINGTNTLTVTVPSGSGDSLVVTIYSELSSRFLVYKRTFAVPTNLVMSDTFSLPYGATDSGMVTLVSTAPFHGSKSILTLNGFANPLPSNVTSIANAVTLAQHDSFALQVSGQLVGDSITVTFAAGDTARPVLSVSSPLNHAILGTTSAALSGTATDRLPVQVSAQNPANGLNWTAATMLGNGTWSVTGIPLQAGQDTLFVAATDNARNFTLDTLLVVSDATPPSLFISYPSNGQVRRFALDTVIGTAGDQYTHVTVSVNGTPGSPNGLGIFTIPFALTEGANTQVVTATNGGGVSTTQTLYDTLVTHPPTITISTPTSGTATDSASVAVRGTVVGELSIPVTATVNGQPITLGTGGAFSTRVNLINGTNTITIGATDAAGNVANVTTTVENYADIVGGTPNLPQDPSISAPALAQTGSSSLLNATSFLYSGPNAPQTGVAAGTIQLATAAVVRGRVLGSTGAPLPGVTVTVLGHPEFGQMITTTPDGQYDLAVNGGTSLVLAFSASGYLPIQRTVTVPWQDYAVVGDATMMPVDTVVTTIDFTQPAEVARGSVEQDSSGTRRATMIFLQGTTATMVMPDSSTQPLATPSVRATEYTVGTNGPSQMPGALPPTSAYTYAVALTADQAAAAGASSVQFSQPVSVYVENFLNIPLGISVPAGSYDRTHGLWVPGPDGVVIKVVGAANGVAEIAVDSTGVAADSATLAEYGFTTPELQQVASLYSAGQSLWRVQVTHFTDYDFNFPNATGGGPGGGGNGPPQNCDCSHTASGSIIAVEAQALGESIPLPGTPYTLNYSSDQTPGYAANRLVRISVLPDSVPVGLQTIAVHVTVAGRDSTMLVTPAPGLGVEYLWDGLDAFGRPVHGTTPITYASALQFANHDYTGQYYSPAVSAETFGSGGTQLPIGTLRVTQGSFSFSQTATVSQWDSRGDGIGGWTLDVHHTYDPVGRVLYRGDGTTVHPQLVSTAYTLLSNSPTPLAIAVGSDGSLTYVDRLSGVQRLAANGTTTYITSSPQNGGPAATCGATPMPASSVSLTQPQGMSLAPDGTIYVADYAVNCVFTISPTTGLLSTLAGSATSGFSGDGGPASSATLSTPYDVVIGPGGDLYISDYGNARIRRINPAGIITTYAGGGAGAMTDGAVASQTSFAADRPARMAVGSDGSVYFGTAGDGIWRITPDGILHILSLPFGQICTSGAVANACEPGGSADAVAIAVDQAGNVYGSTGDNDGVVYEISNATGLFTNIVGCHLAAESSCGSVNGQQSGYPPLYIGIGYTNGLAVTPDGTLYTGGVGELAKTALPLPGVGPGTITVASSDGSEVYQFDSTGRHLATYDATTGVPTFRFTYDTTTGLLTTVTDRNGLVTTIQHTNGVPTAIVGPYGQSTTLSVDANGYLRTAVDPAGDTVQLTHNPNGLLTQLVDATGYVHAFGYDSLGRLHTDQDPSGTTQTFGRNDSAATATVTAVDGAGQTTTTSWQQLPSGDRQETTVSPDGSTRTLVSLASGGTVETDPDGTTVTTVQSPDPQFGMMAPYTSVETIAMPSGTTMHGTQARHLTANGSGNGTTSLVDSVTMSGTTLISSYDSATGQVVLTTPSGRTATDSLDASGRIVRESMFGIATLSTTYDAQGRLSVEQSGGRTWSYAYDDNGNVKSFTDAIGRETQFVDDAAGRVTTQTMPDGRSITFGYDAAGHLTSVTPPTRPTHRLHYNASGLLDQYIPPAIDSSSPATLYTYNGNQQPTTIARPDSVTITLNYDPFDRLGSISIPGRGIQLTYDAGTSFLSRAAPTVGDTVTFVHDGPFVTGMTWTGPIPGSVATTYDSTLRITQQTVNGAFPVALSYDADGLLTNIGTLAINRDPTTGMVIGTVLGSITTADILNGHGELISRTVSRNGSPLAQLTYNRDSAGRATALTEAITGQTTAWSYQYDLLGDLTTVAQSGQTVQAFQYDTNFNRIAVTSVNGVMTSIHDVQDRLLSDSSTYSYSRNGDLRQRTRGDSTTSYTYDALGCLTQVVLPSGTAINYSLDAQNRRVGKSVNGSLVKGWLYQGRFQPVAELGPNGSVVSRFVYGSQPTVPDYMVRDDSTYRIITDAIGSVLLVVNTSSGSIAQQISYDAFGNVLSNSNPGFQPFGFAGGFYDDDTRLVRFGARDYDPSVGRWTTKDQLLFSGSSTNLYTYAGNDPVNSTDPYGLSPDDPTFLDELAPFVDEAAKAAETSTAAAPEGVGEGVGVTIAAAIIATGTYEAANQRTYITYTMTNPSTGQVYSGRASGWGTPEQILARRYSHGLRPGFLPPVLDKCAKGWPKGWAAIRGREQQLIDSHGGAQSDGGSSGNTIRGVSKDNLLGSDYWNASNDEFGTLAPFTGKY